MYRIYSSEHPGHSFNFGFSRDGAYSREALSFEGSTHYLYQKNIKILSTCRFNQTMRTVITTRIKCLMFKIMCKTPLFTKKQYCNLNQLYYRTFYSCNHFKGNHGLRCSAPQLLGIEIQNKHGYQTLSQCLLVMVQCSLEKNNCLLP